MELIRSNRTEALADALASRVRDNPLPPFKKEAIVVQSQGMQSWLTLALAERLGVWANPCFPFPRKAIEQLLEGFSAGPSEEAKAYDRERLQWTVAGLLLESAPAELRPYLGEPADVDRVLRFATSIAQVFDEYVVYRPTLLRIWEKGEGKDWQAELWRRVVAKLGPHDLASRIGSTLPSLRSPAAAERACFQRLHLFSLETLPPLFLEFFSALSKVVPTTLYLLEPSSEYLDDLAQSPQLSLPVEGANGDDHPFLREVGRLSRDFQQLVLDVDESVSERIDLFEAPERRDLLSAVQADILELREVPTPENRDILDRSDRSISVHECPGAMREVQVVHDLLRGVLEDDATIGPEDVVVMTPDLDTYAPLFRAVFARGAKHRIPFEVHDRRTRDDAAFYDDFLTVLEVLDSRFSVLDVVRLMDASSMRREFQFSLEERARLTDLLAAAGVRWGIDGEHRAQHELPPEDLHTWRMGLRRLFLGFACMPDSMEVFEGLQPRGAPSLDDAELVARLSRLCEILFDLQEHSNRPLAIEEWARRMESLCTSLFAEDDERSRAVHRVRTSLDELRSRAVKSGFAGKLSLATLRRELARLLVDKTPAVGFLRRGVTLSELVPLRSVPFRVICLVGMGEDFFPRADDHPRFAVTRGSDRIGDRNKRDDDRHSFLQAILCARDRVIISYSATQKSVRAGANPSPVVWELCETVNRYYRCPDGDPLLKPVSHSLHAFDSRNYDGQTLPRSFSTRHLEIARTIDEPAVDTPRIELVTDAQPPEPIVSVGELTTWLWNPARAFIDKTLRARFDEPELYEPTGALTEIGNLEAATVGNGALVAKLRGDALDQYLRAAPEFPDGSPGVVERDRLALEIAAVSARSEALRSSRETRVCALDANVGGVVLSGRIDGLCGDTRIVERFTRIGRKAELRVWVEHLLMQAVNDPELPQTSQLVMRRSESGADVVTFRRADDPKHLLGELIALYEKCRSRPLPLFEGSSRAFAEGMGAEERDAAVKDASAKLKSQRQWDPRLDYLFGLEDPFDDPDFTEAFGDAAVAVYGPLFEHRSIG